MLYEVITGPHPRLPRGPGRLGKLVGRNPLVCDQRLIAGTKTGLRLDTLRECDPKSLGVITSYSIHYTKLYDAKLNDACTRIVKN